MYLLPTVFIPSQLAKVQLKVQDLTDIVSNLYSNCQIQELIESAVGMLSAEGGANLMTRLGLGAGGEIPFYLTKITDSAEGSYCLKGQSTGKLFSLIFNWTI